VRFLRSGWLVLRGCIVIAVLTAASYRLHLNSAAAGFLYLIAVVLNCLDGGFREAAIVSVFAVACLDFFFIQPLFAFTVADPVDAAALAAFLTTSLLVTRLASKAREEATAASLGRRQVEQLYELAQTLLALDPLRADPSHVLDSVRRVLHLRAACIFDGAQAELAMSGASRCGLGERTREAYLMGCDIDEPAAHLTVRCLRAAGKQAGALGLEGLDDQKLMAGPVAALVAAELERARAVRVASEAAAQARSEALRTAILDALAHEFKTPLATILTAAGGLEAAGPLAPGQRELARLLEEEATRLSALSTRLLRLARADSEDVTPRLTPLDIGGVLVSLIERYAEQYPDRTFSFRKKGEGVEALADPELFELAVGQLFDNACRYAPAGEPVEVTLQFAAASAAVIVWNGGEGIPPGDARHIFERFYRGARGRDLASGTGLGLYVSRKIAVAHGGRLELDSEAAQRGGVAFRFTIPVWRGGPALDQPAAAHLDRGR